MHLYKYTGPNKGQFKPNTVYAVNLASTTVGGLYVTMQQLFQAYRDYEEFTQEWERV